MLDTFNDTRAATATVPSVAVGVTQATGVLSGAFVHKFGPRCAGVLSSLLFLIAFTSSFLATSVTYLVFSIGICYALGVSLAIISCAVAIRTIFDDKSSVMALSVLSTGSGVGGMIYPYLIDALNEQYGLRGILLIIGGITSHGLAASLLYGQIANNVPETDKTLTQSYNINTIYTGVTDNEVNGIHADESTHTNYVSKQRNRLNISDKYDYNIKVTTKLQMLQPESEKGHTIFESFRILFQNKCYVTFCMGITFIMPALTFYTIFFVDIFIDKGFSISDASFGLVIFNIFSVMGRLSPGALTQLRCISTLTVPMIGACCGILATITLFFAESFLVTIICTCLLGFASGVLASVFSVTTAVLVGKHHLSNGIGILYTLNCLPNVAVGPLCGMLRDMTGSYKVVFIVAAVMMGVGLLIFILAQYFRSQTKKSSENGMPVFYTTKL